MEKKWNRMTREKEDEMTEETILDVRIQCSILLHLWHHSSDGESRQFDVISKYIARVWNCPPTAGRVNAASALKTIADDCMQNQNGLLNGKVMDMLV
jgi:hypothetical protein